MAECEKADGKEDNQGAQVARSLDEDLLASDY